MRFYYLIFLLVAADATKDDIGSKLVRIYDECTKSDGMASCLKRKAILFFDRAARLEHIPLMDGVEVVRTADPGILVSSEKDIDASLPRNLQDKDGALTDMLWDRVAAFANSRTIQMTFPKLSSEDLSKGVVEGRGKMKKMMNMMAMGFAMKMAAMVPLAIAGLFVLAGKALIVSKIALLLAGIIGLKKIIAQKNSGGHESHGWSSGGGSGGWDRRSYNDVSADLAYSAYKKS